MTSFEKTVKLACKPKAAPPKAKVRPLIIIPQLSTADPDVPHHPSRSISTQ